MKTLLTLILFAIWGIIIFITLWDWVRKHIEANKLSKMEPLEKIGYLMKAYGKDWQRHYE